MPKKGQFSKNATADSIRQREYNSKPSSKKDRASRNAARSEAMKAGKVRKGDGKDIDHKDSNPRNNKKGNTQVMSASKNRAMNQYDKRKKK
jgi:ribosomal protein S21